MGLVLPVVEVHDQNAVLETIKSIGRLVEGDTGSGGIDEVLGGEVPETTLQFSVLFH
jgi:hypothetical protein